MRALALLGAAGVFALAACGSKAKPRAEDAGAPVTKAAVTKDKESEPAPKPGMAWIPAGTFVAGTPVTAVPRVADEELPGTPTPMNGFYIDLLPYPNEPNVANHSL